MKAYSNYTLQRIWGVIGSFRAISVSAYPSANLPRKWVLTASPCYMLVEIEKSKVGMGKMEYIPNENPEIVNLEHILSKSFPANNWPAFNEEEHTRYSLILGNDHYAKR